VGLVGTGELVTVAELIAALQALPAEQRGLPVWRWDDDHAIQVPIWGKVEERSPSEQGVDELPRRLVID
jgi:hypothetical protein